MNLDQIKALIEAATPGPWSDEEYTCQCCHFVGTTSDNPNIPTGDNSIMYASNGLPCLNPGDAAFIAASRTLMPRMEASLTRIRERCEEFPDNPLARDILDEIAALEAE